MDADTNSSCCNYSDLDQEILADNGTDTRHYYGHTVVAILSVTMVIFMVFSFTGNALVILTVARHKGMKTRTNMFIVNLAVADMLTAIFNMPFSLITIIQGDWIFGEAFCQFNGFTLPLFFIVSIHTLMYISIHKYISITRPFSRFMTTRKIYFMVFASWLWAALCATATLKGGNHVLYKKGTSQCGPSIPDELKKYIHSITITTCNYIIPLAVMSFCYCNIFREIHEHMNRIRETSNIDLQNSLDQQRKISCTLFLVLACFIVCWTPYICYTCAVAFFRDKVKVPLLSNPVAYWCGYMNSACNPIIYALRNPSFRQGYMEILCKYKGFVLGGSLITRPSGSPLGTMKASPNHLSFGSKEARIVSSQHQRPQPYVPKANTVNEGILERRRKRRKGNIHVPKLSLTSLRLERPGDSSSYHRYLLQKKSRFHPLFLKRSLSFEDFKNRIRNGSTSNHISLFSLQNDASGFTDAANERSLPKSRKKMSRSFSSPIEYPSSLRTVYSSDSVEYGYSSGEDEPAQAVKYPTVVVDVASLRSLSNESLSFSNPRTVEEATKVVLTTANGGSFALRSTSVTLRDDAAEEPKSSPLSVKSLEMGRAPSRSFHFSRDAYVSRFSAVLGARRKDKPESPLYAASKEQLMQWVSQERLDRLETAKTVLRSHQTNRPYSSRFSPKWFTGLRRNRFKYFESAKDDDIEDKITPRY